MSEDTEKLERLENLNKKLYMKGVRIRSHRQGPLHQLKQSVSKTWEDVKKAPMKETALKVATKSSLFKKFFIFSAVLFGVAIIFAFLTFLGGTNTVSNSNIEIAVLGNTFTAGGEDLPLEIEVTNKNAVALDLADLIVEYPKGGDSTSASDTVRLRSSLGTIGAGKTVRHDMTVSLFGTEGSTRTIKLSIEYRVAGSNAIFVKDRDYAVTISSAPVVLSVDAPTQVSPNQEYTFTVKTTINAQKTATGMLLRIDYPSGFKFESATPDPTTLDHIWALGDLAPGAEKDITVKGIVYGADGEDRAFHIYAGSANAKDQTTIGVVYNSLLHTVSIIKPFIQANIVINGDSSDTITAGSQTDIQGQIHWANNLPTRITDAEITIKLSGNALKKTSVQAFKGFYNSSAQTIVWDKTTDSTIATIEPGDTGTEDFTISSLPLFGGSASLLSNPSITIEVSIKGKQPAEGGVLSEVNSSEKKTIKINSDFQIAAEAAYYKGPFANTGPIPPKAETATTYTVTWILTNTSNNISGAEVHALLPAYVNWVGAKSPDSENISYDETTRTVSWKIGNVASGVGYTSDPRKASFQVSLLPSSSQIGSVPQLLLQSTMTGKDVFTGSNITSTHAPLNTRLSNDSGFTDGDEKVVQ